MNVSKPDPGPGTGLGILAIAAPIALLFAAVFRPEMVLFSNDGTPRCSVLARGKGP